MEVTLISKASQKFKDVMSLIPTAVGIVWYLESNEDVLGCTISSFISVSIEEKRETVAFVLKEESRTAHQLKELSTYRISILSQNQSNIAKVFGSGMSASEKSKSIAQYDSWYKDTLCEFRLQNIQQVTVGSSVIFLAKVISFSSNPVKLPLVYQSRRFSSVSQADRG